MTASPSVSAPLAGHLRREVPTMLKGAWCVLQRLTADHKED
ncbi:hypothetical protein [Pandoraea soli]|nr:hypothetical protein [Pandoraea soli]